ncbi:hypothetical protein TNCV_1743801 [Trichonephila clavipes]|nr:hypothetical protein TNCV_1743801 [Trichonephila clavipes]
MIEKDNVMCGTMVIVKEDFTPVCNWLLGRVVEVNHGSDGKALNQYKPVVRELSMQDKLNSLSMKPGNERSCETLTLKSLTIIIGVMDKLVELCTVGSLDEDFPSSLMYEGERNAQIGHCTLPKEALLPPCLGTNRCKPILKAAILKEHLFPQKMFGHHDL